MKKAKSMVAKKRKYTWRKRDSEEFVEAVPSKVEEAVEPVQVEPVQVEPVVEKPPVRCECGDYANPDSHQCWRCSHRS